MAAKSLDSVGDIGGHFFLALHSLFRSDSQAGRKEMMRDVLPPNRDVEKTAMCRSGRNRRVIGRGRFTWIEGRLYIVLSVG